MAKISKRLLNKHNEAIERLSRKDIDFMDREFIYDNYHEGAGKMNNLISAHFTPKSIADSMTFCHRYDNWVDIGAGIGRLSYSIIRQNQMGQQNPVLGICVENCTEYYEVGKKLLPECIWINGSIFDQNVIDEIKLIMNNEKFSIVSNPPYGNQVKGNHPLMHYTGAKFEYKAIEMGAILGACDGCFLIPQESVPFRISGQRGGTYSDSYISSEYKKFLKETGLHIEANAGFDTTVHDEYDWKDVSILTEIGIVEYEELEYVHKRLKPKAPTPKAINQQMNLF